MKRAAAILRESGFRGLKRAVVSQIQAQDGRARLYDSQPNSTHAKVLGLVGNARSILELGCASGYMTRAFSERGAQVTVVELDPVLAEKARPYCARLIVGDLDELDLAKELRGEQFDVAVCADILEHLAQPWRTLQQVRSLLAPNGFVAASIPAITHVSVALELLKGNFDYRPLGLLDETHRRFFSKRSVFHLFERAGYWITELERTYAAPHHIEIAQPLTEFGPELVKYVESNDEALTYQFTVKAVPFSETTELERLRRQIEDLQATLSQVEPATAHARQEALGQQLDMARAALSAAERRIGELDVAEYKATMRGMELEARAKTLEQLADKLHFENRAAELDREGSHQRSIGAPLRRRLVAAAAPKLAPLWWRFPEPARRVIRPLLWRLPGVDRLRRHAAGGPGPSPRVATPDRQIRDEAQVLAISRKIAPLTLAASSATPQRINLLIPTMDFTHFFGGYITKLLLASHLAGQGYAMRVVIVDYCDFRPQAWRQRLAQYPGLEQFFEKVEICYAFDRSLPLPVSPSDVFIASTWWTAHIANRAVSDLRADAFIYLIQEYEPFTFPMGSFAALADETYGFKHYAVFSTDLLRDYFRSRRMGVFSSDVASGALRSLSFENPITDVGTVTEEAISNRFPRRLLFYARPEGHAARNMFEVGVIALSQAIATGAFSGGWEFTGIGTVEEARAIALANGERLKLLPRTDPATYRQVLRMHDVGLSLMYTPHPSLVPIEMASAGMLVVTNTFENKTASALLSISRNFLPVDPTVPGITAGLLRAASLADDYAGRVAGARFHWSRSWQESFDADFTAKLRSFIDQATPRADAEAGRHRTPHGIGR